MTWLVGFPSQPERARYSPLTTTCPARPLASTVYQRSCPLALDLRWHDWRIDELHPSHDRQSYRRTTAVGCQPYQHPIPASSSSDVPWWWCLSLFFPSSLSKCGRKPLLWIQPLADYWEHRPTEVWVPYTSSPCSSQVMHRNSGILQGHCKIPTIARLG